MRRPDGAGDGGAWAGYVTLGFTCLGILLQWGRGRWASAVYQTAILLTMLAWSWSAARSDRPLRWSAVWWPVALVPVWAAAQLGFASSVFPWATADRCVEWTVHASAAWMVAQAAGSQRFRADARVGLSWFAGCLAALALLQFFTSEGRVYWLFASGYPDRVLGPFVYHNKYAQFVELCIPLMLYQALACRRHAAACLVGGALLYAGVVAGGSRAGVVLGAAEIPLVLYLAWRRGLLRAQRWQWVAAQALGALALGGILAGWGVVYGRMTAVDPLSDVRLPLMEASLRMILAKPWTGTGLGTWPTAYPAFASFDNGLVANQAHCDWLQWAVEGGVPFLLMMLCWVGLVGRRLLSSVWGVGFLVVLVHGLIDYPFQQLPAFATLLVCVALVAAEDGRSLLTGRRKGDVIGGGTAGIGEGWRCACAAALVHEGAGRNDGPGSPSVSPITGQHNLDCLSEDVEIEPD